MRFCPRIQPSSRKRSQKSTVYPVEMTERETVATNPNRLTLPDGSSACSAKLMQAKAMARVAFNDQPYAIARVISSAPFCDAQRPG
jgi:hypothetical protein